MSNVVLQSKSPSYLHADVGSLSVDFTTDGQLTALVFSNYERTTWFCCLYSMRYYQGQPALEAHTMETFRDLSQEEAYHLAMLWALSVVVTEL